MRSEKFLLVGEIRHSAIHRSALILAVVTGGKTASLLGREGNKFQFRVAE